MTGFESLESSARALSGLRDMYDDKTTRFKSKEQAKAMQLTLEKKEDVLVILPTVGGKSLMFQLAAWMEKDKTTVIIVPFVAIIEDMKDKCDGLDLSCYEWRKNDKNIGLENTQIVLVGVENAGRLSRIVIDECHTILMHYG